MPLTRQNIRDQALVLADQRHKAEDLEGERDQDYNFKEFDSAMVEEENDRVRESRRQTGRQLLKKKTNPGDAGLVNPNDLEIQLKRSNKQPLEPATDTNRGLLKPPGHL